MFFIFNHVCCSRRIRLLMMIHRTPTKISIEPLILRYQKASPYESLHPASSCFSAHPRTPRGILSAIDHRGDPQFLSKYSINQINKPMCSIFLTVARISVVERSRRQQSEAANGSPVEVRAVIVETNHMLKLIVSSPAYRLYQNRLST